MRDLKIACNIVTVLAAIIGIIFAIFALSGNLAGSTTLILSVLLITFSVASIILKIYTVVFKKHNTDC